VAVEAGVERRTDRVHWRARALAVLAAATSVPAAGAVYFALDEYALIVIGAAVLISLAPLMAHKAATFGYACCSAAAVLVVLAVLGAYAGLITFLPCALILLMAPCADPSEATGRSAAVCVASLMVIAGCGAAWVWW